MPRLKTRCLGWALAAVLLMLPELTLPRTGQAATFGIAPTRLTLDPERRSGAVTLTNEGEAATLVQVQTFVWRGSLSSADLQPTSQLLAVPAIFSLEPGARQIIRVAARDQGPLAEEQSYRLLITEVPTEDGPAEDGVRFAIRLSLPVFLAPEGAAPSAKWLVRAGNNGAELVVANEGSSHLRVEQVELLTAAGASEPQATISSPAYVLAGQTHVWPLSISPDDQGHYLRAETNIGELEALAPYRRH